MLTALQQQLDGFLAFATGDVLMWHDPTGAAARLAGQLELPQDVTLCVEQDVTRFELKCHLNNIAPDERVLLVRTRRHRVEEDDWLADIEARAESFEPDLAGLSLDTVESASADRPRDTAEPDTLDAALPASEQEAKCIEQTGTSNATAPDEQPTPPPTAQLQLAGAWYARDAFCEALAHAGAGIMSEDEMAAAATAAGYTLFADCAVCGDYARPAEYYRTLFTAPLVARDSLPDGMLTTPSFKTYLTDAQATDAVFDYDADMWVTAAGLQELGINKADLDTFAREAVTASVNAGIPQFTIPWLRANGAGIALLAYELSDAFYESVLLSRRRFCTRGHLGGRRIFAEPHTQARGRDLVASLVAREDSLDIDDLLDILREAYGISVTITQLITLIRNTNLFYSPELDRVYVSHDQFVREVE